jgi:hypothetical protein
MGGKNTKSQRWTELPQNSCYAQLVSVFDVWKWCSDHTPRVSS